jgi:arylsulfatase
MALLGLGGCRAEPANLLLVSIDTLRADHLPSYGYERDTSPAIDALAREGVLWENAYATSPATVASHASLFTGRFPYQHGALNYSTPLPDPELTLAELLSRAGYRTFAVATSVRFHRGSGFPQGFAHYETLHRLPKNARSRVATDRVLELAAGGEPFFAFVHYFGPHAPYWPPEPYRSRWHPGPAPELPGGPETFVFGHRAPGQRVTPRVLAYLEALYDAEILYLDGDLARLLGGLDDLGLTERTLVVLVSDHGEEFKEHDGLSHGRTLYEESLRIPLVLRWPGVLPAGRRVGRSAQLVDVLPTVLELLGQPIPPGLPGRSLAGDLDAEAGGGTDRVLGQRGTAQWSVAATLPEGRLKVVHEEGRPPQLFDLGADPGEQRDLGGERPRLLERLGALAPEPLRTGPQSAASVEVPEEVRRRLAEIGYADEVAGEDTGRSVAGGDTGGAATPEGGP